MPWLRGRWRRLGLRHRDERDALDDLEAEAADAGDLAGVVREQAQLAHAEIGEHLRAEAELAQRVLALAGARRRGVDAASLEVLGERSRGGR